MPKTALAALLLGCLLLCSGCFADRPAVSEPQKTSGSAPTAGADNKIVLVTGEYAPYTSERLADHGFFHQIVAAVFKEMGQDCEIRFYPWARGEEMVRTGQAWAAFPYGASGKTAQNYLTSEPILSSRHKIFYLKANEQMRVKLDNFNDIADFKDYIVGGANGYWYGTQADLTRRGLVQVEWADDIYGLVRMLYSTRIDLFIEDELVGWDVIGFLLYLLTCFRTSGRGRSSGLCQAFLFLWRRLTPTSLLPFSQVLWWGLCCCRCSAIS